MRTEEDLATNVADVTTVPAEETDVQPTDLKVTLPEPDEPEAEEPSPERGAGPRARVRAQGRGSEVQRPHRDSRGRPRHRREGDHRVHRAVRMRQDHGAALPQPHARHHAGRAGARIRDVPRREPVRIEGRRRRGAPPDRHGVPEAQPVPEDDLRQRGVRAEDQRPQAVARCPTSSSTRSRAPRSGTR